MKATKNSLETWHPEQIETHIGLEKVRNVMDGLPAEHGIKRIGKLIEQIQKQEAEKKKNTNKNRFRKPIYIDWRLCML